ncbi:MAG: class I SAM-dependent methyltransferase [Zoogloeaceae bacterium]|jgi:SAM-dependent methyltransferase|nr:class I SAM-dependent methyltransferase [Zoogloeaceae bacterium]
MTENAKGETSHDTIRDFYDSEYYSNLEIQGEGRLPWHCKMVGRRIGDVTGKQVLDIACGTGEWLGFFRYRGAAAVAGIDLSRKAIDVCTRRLPGGEFHCGPAESLPFADQRFDVITCMGALEHFLDKPRALDEMRRVAKPDAVFLILVPIAGFLTRRLGLYGGTHQVDAREDVLELEEWDRLLHDAGLTVVARWRDLHPVSWSWIKQGSPLIWPIRAAQALALAVWPVRWQYQVYHFCKLRT